MNISIVDSGANEIFFEEIDGAYLGSRESPFTRRRPRRDSRSRPASYKNWPTARVSRAAQYQDRQVPGIIASQQAAAHDHRRMPRRGRIGVRCDTANQDAESHRRA